MIRWPVHIQGFVRQIRCGYFLDFYDPAQPPIQELLDRCARLIAAARKAGIPVFYTAQPGGQAPEDRALLNDFWGDGIPDRPESTRVVDAGAPQPGDTVPTKWRYSAFKRSDLEARLRGTGRDQLLICGVYAHIGCLMTAAEAFMLDIQPFLIGDALADFSREDHEQALRYAAGRCARVCGTNDALRAAEPVRPLPRKHPDSRGRAGGRPGGGLHGPRRCDRPRPPRPSGKLRRRDPSGPLAANRRLPRAGTGPTQGAGRRLGSLNSGLYKKGLANIVSAFGSSELLQPFVDRQSFADENARSGHGVGKGFPTYRMLRS